MIGSAFVKRDRKNCHTTRNLAGSTTTTVSLTCTRFNGIEEGKNELKQEALNP